MAGLKTINHVDMHNRNIVVVVNHLYRNAPVTRARIAKETGLNKATVTSIVRVLIENGFVIERGTNTTTGSVGHPSIDLEINPDAGRVIGAEINGETVTVAVLDLSPNILWRASEPFSEKDGIDTVMDGMVRLLMDAYKAYVNDSVPLLGIVVGLPGLVDLKTNTLLDAPDLGWKNVPIGARIQKEIALPVAIGNLAHMASIAENYFGVSKETEVSLYLNLGVMIHSGIVIMDNVLSGAGGLASEAGHMTVDPDGEACPCGSTGCWNTVASLRALLKGVRSRLQAGAHSIIPTMVEGDLSGLTLQHVIRAAKAGDEVACRAFEQTGFWLGVGIANLVNLLNPESVVLGGTMSAAYDFLLPGIQKEVQRRAFVGEAKKFDIRLSKLREDSCLTGSLAVIYWNLMNRLQYITLPVGAAL